jgi:hypothetical protein
MAASAGFVIVYALTFLLPFVVLRYSRWLNTHFPFTVSPVKQRKIAISLAVVGALAAPFVTGAWQMQPVSLTPISADRKKALMTHMEDSKNCQLEVWNVAIFWCEDWRRELLQGGLYGFSQPKWLALNLFAALGGFVIVFGLTYLVPALARRYWRWLNT